MTSTRPRFFSIHKLFKLSLFIIFFIFTLSPNFSEAATVADLERSVEEAVKKFETAGCKNNSWVFGPTCSAILLEIDAAKKNVCTAKNLQWDGSKCVEKDLSAGVCTYKFSLAGCLGWIADLIVGNIVALLNGILSWILSIAMYLLDLVIYITVVKFTDNFANLGLNIAPQVSESGAVGRAILGGNGDGLIYYIWGMLRDFVNLLLLITIIYYAVKTMFEGFENKAKIFLYLLIFSIVINFSLFFVKFAIDLSNILSLQAYTLMANPASFETWKGFRENAGGGSQVFGYQVIPKATLGDYLLNIAQIGGAHKVSTGASAAEQRINQGMKASWVYQVGVMLMYIGLIYLVLFLTGLLIMRAAAFLLAMLLAALLAADIFFSTFKEGDVEFADSIRGYTEKIRNDFYEALVKGPVLFLFLFLLGILSNAIFNQALSSEITDITKQSGEFQVFGDAFSASLAIFLKFAMFFALAKVLFEKLQVMKFGANSWVGKYSKKGIGYATSALGLGSRMVGYAGQNTIGRLASNRDGRLGRLLNNVNNSKFVQSWKNADGGTIVGRVQRRLGGAITGSIKGIKDGSYDVVGATSKGLKKVDDRVGGRIAKAVDKTSFGLSGESDFGPGVTTTRDQRDQAAADERKKKRDAELAATEHSNAVSAEYYAKAAQELKISDIDGASLENLEKMLDGSYVGPLSLKQKKFVDDYNSTDLKTKQTTQLKVKGFREKAEAKAVEKAHHEDEHMKEKIEKEYLSGKRKAESYAGMTKDVGSMRGLNNQREDLKLDTAGKSKKETQAEAKKFPVIFTVKQDLDATTKEIDRALAIKSDVLAAAATAFGGVTDDRYKKYETIFGDLEKAKTAIEADVAKIGITSGNPSEDARVKIVNAFSGDKDLRGSVVKNKNTAADLLGSLFDSGSDNVVVTETIKKLKENAQVELDALKLPEEKAKKLASGMETREYVREVQKAESSLQGITKTMNDGFRGSIDISAKAKKNEEAIKAQFEPKADEAKH